MAGKSQPTFLPGLTAGHILERKKEMADPTNPDASKDFNNLVPTLTVGWDTLPSYIDGSDDSQGGGGPSYTEVADSGPIYFDAASVRASESTLLAQARSAVSNYEALHQSSDSAIHGQFWGPAHPSGVAINTDPSTGGGGASLGQTINSDREILATLGDEAARNFNPLLQKGLARYSSTLSLWSSYIKMITAAYQSYSHLDRASRFPGPPGSIKR
ncbi:hypothetical protein ACFQ51_54585 [Streptomyces kaempferi]